VQQAYSRIWTAFSDAASQQQLRADAADGRGALVSERLGVVTAEAILYLPNWPYKAVSAKKYVDITVKVTETFAPDLSQVVRSTTCVGYFHRDELPPPRRSVPLLELHYDYEQPPREAHPMFHAQLGTTDWPTEKLESWGFARIERTPDGHYSNARIPTAFMGYVPVLVALAADHLSPKNFRRMMSAALFDDGSRVDPECTILVEKLRPGGIPHAHHWYDQRYVVHEWTEKGGKLHRASVPVLGESFSGRDLKALRSQVLKKLGVAMADLDFRAGQPR